MGNDGGSIPKRRELVKEAARAPTSSQLKETVSEQQSHNWTTCPLNNKLLLQPIVSDCLGRLFSKESVLEYLLGSTVVEEEDGEAKMKLAEQEKIVGGVINSLKDIVEVLFEQDSDVKRGPKFVCPVTNKALGPGGAKAVYLVPCGHAFSADAIKQLSDERICPQCSDKYEAENVIPILPVSDADVKSLEARTAKLKEEGLTHALKKSSSKKKRKHDDKDSNKKKKTDGAKLRTAPSINDAATASLTAKVLSEHDARIKKRKLQNNDNIKSLFSNRAQDQKLSNSADFMTRGYAMPNKTK